MNITMIKRTSIANTALAIAVIALVLLGYWVVKPSVLRLLNMGNEMTIPHLSEPVAALAGEPAVLLLNTDLLATTIDGGEVTLAARVRDAEGGAVSGVTVHFSSAQGSVAPANVVTGADGMATATFTAGSVEGQALITVEVGALARQAAVQLIKPDNDTTAHTLSLQPSVIKLNPGQSINVAATLRDGSGQPLAGEVVSAFGSIGQVTPSSVVSDDAGRISFTYRAGNSVGQAMLTVLAGYASASATLQVGTVNVPGVLDQKQFLPMMIRQ